MKKTMKKVVASFCLGAAALTSVPAVSWAETAVEPLNCQLELSIAPYMLYIEDAQCSLDITGSTATVDCFVTGRRTTATKAKVIAELQVKNGSSWIPVAIWTDTQDAYRATVYESKSITPGNTYRVKATVTVWEGTASETRTIYSS